MTASKAYILFRIKKLRDDLQSLLVVIGDREIKGALERAMSELEYAEDLADLLPEGKDGK